MADLKSLQNIFGGSSTPAKPKVNKRSSGLENIFASSTPAQKQVEKPPEKPYFAAVDKTGNSFGFSNPEKDVSGRPFFAFRKPGDTSTTTDKTRVATKFDPRTPSKQTKEDFYNPRAVGLREEMKNEFGLSYDDELDHKIALAISGSNDRENLRKVAADKNNDGNLAASLALEVADGKKSLFDAQVNFAKSKGLETPFTGEKPPGFLQKIFQSAKSEIKEKAGQVKDFFAPKKAEAAIPATGTPSNPEALQNIFEKSIPGPGAVIADLTPMPSIGSAQSTPTLPNGTSTVKQLKKVGEYLFDEKAEIAAPRVPFLSKKQQESIPKFVGPRIITGAAAIPANLLSAIVEAPVRLVVSAGPELKANLTGQSTKLPFDPTRLGLPESETNEYTPIFKDNLDRLNALDEERPNTPNLNLIQSFFETTFNRAILDPIVTGDVAKGLSHLLLNATKSSPELGLSSTAIKDMTPTEALQEVGNRFVTRANQIVAANTNAQGVLSASGKREMTKLVAETKRLGEAFSNQTIPELNALGKFFDNAAVRLNQDVLNLSRPLGSLTGGVARAGEQTIPGYRPAYAGAPAGMSVQPVEPVGFEKKTVEYMKDSFKEGGNSANRIKQYETAIAQGDAPASSVYKDVPNKVFKDDIAQQIIDDAADGFRLVHKHPELSDPFKKLLDPKNLTAEKLFAAGTKTIDDATSGAFKGFNDISTSVLDKMVGRVTVSKQFISDLTNSSGLKQTEREIIRQILTEYPSTGPILVREFANKVKAELLPLTTSSPADFSKGLRGGEKPPQTWYEHVVLPEGSRGPIKNYSEHIYQSPISNTAGDIHFMKSNVPNYFGHTRIEDTPAKTRRVLEIQSDLYQRGRLERSIPEGTVNQVGVTEFKTPVGVSKINKLRQYNDPSAHFRIAREEVKRAATAGMSKIQFPTGETAMKIEGLGNVGDWRVGREGAVYESISPENIKVGLNVYNGHDNWVITQILENGKFNAVPEIKVTAGGKALNYKNLSGAEKTNYEMQLAEQFDISGKVDTSNPIYRFYEKTLGRYLASRYGAKKITDAQGVTWYEFPITKDMAKQPVMAFKKQIFSKLDGPKATLEEIKEIIFKDIPKDRVRLIFSDELIDGKFVGRYEARLDGMKDVLKPIIRLYQEGGKSSVSTAVHESGHYIFDNFLTAAERTEALALAAKNISFIDKMKYKISGYKGKDVVLEEYLVDKYAQAKMKEDGFTGPLKSFFEMFDAVLKKISETYKKVVDRIKKIAKEKGTQGGYANFFDDGSGEFRAGKDEIEKGSKELRKELKKEAPKPTLPLDKKIAELEQQRVALEETVKNHPAREVSKYANKDGVLPQVIGEGGKFAKSGDQLAKDLGYDSSEDLRLEYANYRLLNKRLDSIKSELAETRRTRANAVKEDKDAKSLGSILERTARKTDDELAYQARIEKVKKGEQETVRQLAEEAKYKRTYQDKINAEKKAAAGSTGLYAKIKAVLNPVKSVDEKTQKILTAWFEKKIVAKQIAQEEFLKYRNLGLQDMKEIHEYQAGKPVQYIRDALDTMGTEFKRRGLDFDFRDNYLPQVWDNPPKDANRAINRYLKDKGMSDEEIKAYMAGEPISETKALRLKLRPNFVKDRFWPDYKTGMKYGLKPKYKTPAQLIAYYRESGEIAIANRELLEELKREAKLLSGEDAPDTWLPVTLRFSREGLYASPRLADLINGKFRDEENLAVYELVTKGVAATSRFLQEMVLSAGVPFTDINFFTIGQAIKLWTTAIGEVTTGQFAGALSSLKASFAFIRANSNTASAKFFFENKDMVMRMARQKLDVTANVGNYQSLYKKLSDAFPAEPGILNKAKGVANVIGVVFSKAFNEKTFSSMMPQISVQIFKDSFYGALRQGLLDAEAEKFAAQVVESFAGVIKEVGRGDTTQETLGSLFFAPKFREGLINVFVNAGKGFSSEFKNKAFSKSRALILGMAITYGLYNLLNKEINDEYMWSNPPGKEFSLRIPLKNKSGDSVYIDFMPSILALPRAVGVGLIALARGDFSTFGQKVGSFFSMPIKIFAELASNQDYFGQEIYKETDTPKQKIIKMAEHAGLSINHPFIRETYKYISEDKPLYQVIAHMLELPLKFSNLEKEAAAEYYEALEKEKKVRARIVERITPIFDKNQELIANGNMAEADRIYRALTVEDRKIYDSIKTTKKRQATMKRKIAMEQIYNNLQKLIGEGRVEEAVQIYNGLSEVDRDLYDKIKADKEN